MADLNEQINEEIMVIRAQMGDDDAFVSLVERYRFRLLSYIQHFIRDGEDVEDVLQETWITVYRKLPHLRANKAFSVWLYRIARSHAIDTIRKKNRYAELPQDFDLPDLSGKEEEIEPHLMFLTDHIHQLINKLKPEFREVILLRFMKNMTYDCIAKMTGCTTGTVKSRLYYAKKALRKEMEDSQNE